MTVPALCAAALEPRIAKLYLSHPLASWRSLAETETYSHPLANFVPDVLRATDLPQIARSIAPRVTSDAWDPLRPSRVPVDPLEGQKVSLTNKRLYELIEFP